MTRPRRGHSTRRYSTSSSRPTPLPLRCSSAVYGTTTCSMDALGCIRSDCAMDKPMEGGLSRPHRSHSTRRYGASSSRPIHHTLELDKRRIDHYSMLYGYFRMHTVRLRYGKAHGGRIDTAPKKPFYASLQHLILKTYPSYP